MKCSKLLFLHNQGGQIEQLFAKMEGKKSTTFTDTEVDKCLSIHHTS